MKRYLLYILAFMVAFSSCSKTDYAPGNIDIEFQFETLPVDLNIVDNPFITCIVRSETGLESVQMMIEMIDGELVPYKTDIREFFNPRHCSIHERLVYTEDMVAFIVRAEDLGGAVKEGRVTFEMTSKVNAPVIEFTAEGISFAEGEPIPEFGFTVSSDADLASVSVQLVESAVSSELLPLIEDFDDAKSFQFNSSEYDLNVYDLNKIPQLVRVVVTDTYGKTSISTLKITYRALPAPVLTMNQVGAAVEFEEFTITGKATSEIGVTRVDCYVLGDGYEALSVGMVTVECQDLNMELTLPGDDIRDYITALKVVATDARNKKAEIVIPITVEPVYESIDASSNLADEINSRFNDNKYRTVKLLLPAGAQYSMSGELLLKKNLKLKADSADDRPVIKVPSEYTFTTDNAVLDVVSFENISFKTSKSGSYFMGNKSSVASIGELNVSGCVFEGYTNSFYRTGGAVQMNSLALENNMFLWANTGSGYSFLHFTQSAATLLKTLVRNCTFTGVLYFHYNNTSNTTTELEISNCTFANSKASNNAYFIAYGQSTTKGTVRLKKNLFGGSNNLTGNCRMLRANNVTKDLSDNYCTKSWKTFVDDSTNNSMNFCTNLPDSEDNAQIFMDYESNNFTLLPGTTAYNYGIGDPRWIK